MWKYILKGLELARVVEAGTADAYVASRAAATAAKEATVEAKIESTAARMESKYGTKAAAQYEIGARNSTGWLAKAGPFIAPALGLFGAGSLGLGAITGHLNPSTWPAQYKKYVSGDLQKGIKSNFDVAAVPAGEEKQKPKDIASAYAEVSDLASQFKDKLAAVGLGAGKGDVDDVASLVKAASNGTLPEKLEKLKTLPDAHLPVGTIEKITSGLKDFTDQQKTLPNPTTFSGQQLQEKHPEWYAGWQKNAEAEAPRRTLAELKASGAENVVALATAPATATKKVEQTGQLKRDAAAAPMIG